MVTDDQIYSTIIPWMRDVGRSVDPEFLAIRAFESSPRPAEFQAERYATVNIVSTVNFGMDSVVQEVYDIGPPSLDVLETVVARRQYMLSLNFYKGADIVSLAETLKASLRSYKVHRNYFTKGSEAPFDAIPVSLGFVRASEVRRLPVEVHEEFEERAEFDVWFNVALTYQDVLESVEEANVHGSLETNQLELFAFDLNVKTT